MNETCFYVVLLQDRVEEKFLTLFLSLFSFRYESSVHQFLWKTKPKVKLNSCLVIQLLWCTRINLLRERCKQTTSQTKVISFNFCCINKLRKVEYIDITAQRLCQTQFIITHSIQMLSNAVKQTKPRQPVFILTTHLPIILM